MNKIMAIAGLVMLVGCNPSPSQAEIDSAQEHISAAMTAIDVARTALELLGILPDYTCGVPRATFIGDVVGGLTADLACATVSTQPEGPDADSVSVTFPAGGCEVLGHTLSGTAVFLYSGGTDRLDLAADFTGLEIDGTSFGTSVGYSQCGDETTYWVMTAGAIPSEPAITFVVDASVAVREGLPVIGDTTIIIDGTAAVSHPDGVDQITFVELEYDVGAYLPKNGSIIIDTASGAYLAVTFSSNSPLLTQVQVAIDDHDPVTIPIPML